MPPFPPDAMLSLAQDDAAARSHANSATRGPGDMPIIEVVPAAGSRHANVSPYGAAPISTWPHAYAPARPPGINPYMSTYPRRPR